MLSCWRTTGSSTAEFKTHFLALCSYDVVYACRTSSPPTAQFLGGIPGCSIFRRGRGHFGVVCSPKNRRLELTASTSVRYRCRPDLLVQELLQGHLDKTAMFRQASDRRLACLLLLAAVLGCSAQAPTPQGESIR